MDKILLAIDAHNMDKNAVAFACYLSRITHSKLTGVFLDNLVLEEEVVINETPVSDGCIRQGVIRLVL